MRAIYNSVGIGRRAIPEATDIYWQQWRVAQTARPLYLCHGAADRISGLGALPNPRPYLLVSCTCCGAVSLLGPNLVSGHGPPSATLSDL